AALFRATHSGDCQQQKEGNHLYSVEFAHGRAAYHASKTSLKRCHPPRNLLYQSRRATVAHPFRGEVLAARSDRQMDLPGSPSALERILTAPPSRDLSYSPRWWVSLNFIS